MGENCTVCAADDAAEVARGRRDGVGVCFVSLDAYPLFNSATDRPHGGAEVDAYMLATELAKDPRFRVSLVTGDFGQGKTESAAGVTIHRAPHLVGKPLRAAWGIWRAMARADADVYFRKGASLVTVLVAAFCRLRGRRLLLRTSNSGECDGTYIRRHRLRGPLHRWALRLAEVVFVQNRSGVAGLAASAGVRAVHVPNAHRPATAAPAEKRTVLWVGRNTPEKRPELFVELAAAVPKEPFVMVCNRSKHGRSFVPAGVPANLELHERVPFAEIGRLFAEARVLVNTSRTEGFPNTFLQAGACGTPILTVNVDPDGMLSQAGCGVCCGEAGKLPGALREMLQGRRCAEMGRRAREYVREHHDLGKVVGQYKAVILGVAADRAAGVNGTACT